MPTYIDTNTPPAIVTTQAESNAQVKPLVISETRHAVASTTDSQATPASHQALPTVSDNQPAQQPVSPNNPCPFLRGLVAQGLLPDDQASLPAVVDAIHTLQQGQDPDSHGKIKPLPSAAIKAIAATANGFSPAQVAHNVRHGVQLNDLRGGPFDKEGAGSRILNTHGDYVQAELERLASFATLKTASDGQQELGLNQQQIQAMLDANFARAKGQRRALDRSLSNGEFPVLLKVLGKQGKDERYLAVKDVEQLFKQRQFPERITDRIGLEQR